MMIFVYWGILILCYFIASRLRNMASRFGFLDKSMMAAVYILVFLMGLRMGINRQVTSALATIGVQALAITLATIGGSILMIFLVRMFFKNCLRQNLQSVAFFLLLSAV